MVRNFKFFLIAFFTFYFLLFIFPSTVHATQFSEVFLRLDRTKTSSPLSGTLCAKPSSGSAGVESKVSITFPSDFTVNATAANWTVTITNLPSGATAWAGIGTATAVSGRTVTFPSGDLTNSTTLYCFNFSSSSSQTSSTAGQKNGIVTTQNASGETISTSSYTISITSSDQIEVVAAVPAQTRDFTLAFASDTKEGLIGANQLLSFTLTCSSNLAYATSFTLEAEWSLGTIPEKNLFAFNVFDYVSGSAGKGYGETTPIIDLAKRKIIWKIKNFPKKTADQKVSFKLKTADRFITEQNLEVNIKARLYTSDLTLTDQALQYTYTPTQLIKTELVSLGLVKHEIRQINDTSFSLLIQTARPTKTTIFYGKTIDSLGKTFVEPTLAEQKLLRLEGLEPQTTYYYQIQIETEKGVVFRTPEIYRVTTSAESLMSSLDRENVLISLRGIILRNKATIELTSPLTVVRGQSPEVFLPFKTNVPTQVYARLVPSQVLGINNLDPIPSLEKTRFLETEAGIFSGKLVLPAQTGLYDLLLETYDSNQSLAQDTLAKVLLVEPLKIVGSDGQFIEGARVYLERYSENLKIYEHFPAESFGGKNPTFSQNGGVIDYVLPKGHYKLKVTALGYKPKETIFSLNPAAGQDYPTVTIEKAPFSLVNTILYYQSIVADTLSFIKYNLNQLASSYLFFNLITAVSFGSLILLTLLSFSLRTHIPLVRLPKYLLFHLKKILPGFSILMHIHGTVVEEDEDFHPPITQATVYIIDADKKIIVSQTSTNKRGEFFSDKLTGGHYQIEVMKKGYEPSETLEYPLPDGLPQQCTISLSKSEAVEESIREAVLWVAKNVIDFSFEFLLIASLVFEILFGYALGWQKVAPFLFVSLANLFMWLIYLRHFFASKT